MIFQVLFVLLACEPLWATSDLTEDSLRGLASRVEEPVPQGQNYTPPRDTPYIASVEIFGSTRLTEKALKEALGSDLGQWLKKGIEGDPEAAALERKLNQKLKEKFGFALAEWSILQYFEPGNLAIHITLDVVEKKDVETRMPFHKRPEGKLSDPGGLISSWLEYENLALKLLKEGKLTAETAKCQKAFFCPFGHVEASLKKYEDPFMKGAKKYEKELLKVAKEDEKPNHRASAIYVLSYLEDGNKLIELCVDRIRDPDAIVRHNALRVLGEMAETRSEYLIPTKPIIEALLFPRVSDRSKAVYVLYNLVSREPAIREQVKKAALPALLELLNSTQPNHWEVAHATLKLLSGKSFAASEKDKWLQWYERLPANKP